MFFLFILLLIFNSVRGWLVDMSNRIHESAILELMSVGLTRYEASLYTAMLSTDSLNYDELIENSDIPYGRFYVIADMLASKGLLEILPGKPKTYHHFPPNEAIHDYLNGAKDRILRALDMESMLSSI